MSQSSSRIPPKLRLFAAVAIAIGLGLCALALVAQALQPDELSSLILPLAVT